MTVTVSFLPSLDLSPWVKQFLGFGCCRWAFLTTGKALLSVYLHWKREGTHFSGESKNYHNYHWNKQEKIATHSSRWIKNYEVHLCLAHWCKINCKSCADDPCGCCGIVWERLVDVLQWIKSQSTINVFRFRFLSGRLFFIFWQAVIEGNNSEIRQDGWFQRVQ